MPFELDVTDDALSAIADPEKCQVNTSSRVGGVAARQHDKCLREG